MLRAATLGVIDFAQYDPWDSWWWKRLHLILGELSRDINKEALKQQHAHSLALVSHSRLTPESWDTARQDAGDALNRYLKNVYPWRAKELGEAGTKSGREQAIETYHEMFGREGEPRYEHMVVELKKALKKLTPRQKEMERKKRRAEAAQRLATAG